MKFFICFALYIACIMVAASYATYYAMTHGQLQFMNDAVNGLLKNLP